jgi:hypothetical protein
MRSFLKILAIVALVAFPGTAGAQYFHINPVPPNLKPQWTRVPGAPRVSWAPNLPTDVFRYRGTYYFFWENFFYQGPRPEGPWKLAGKVPEVFYNVPPAYFKTVKPAGEAPAATGVATPSPKAKIIDIAPTAPAAQPPPQPGAAPPANPETPPKVM